MGGISRMNSKKPKQGYKLVKSLFGNYEEIPEDWEIVLFDDFARIKRGASPRPIADPAYFGNGRGWIRISDVTKSDKYLERTVDYLSELGESESVPVNEGDIIMSIAATVGKPIIVKMKACIHDGFIAFSNLSSELDNEFLYYLLTQIEKKFSGLGQRGTQTNINSQIVAKTKFAKPPLKEQQKIASILSNVDSLINQTQKEIKQTQRLKKGQIQRLLTRGIGHTKFKKVKSLFGQYEEIPEEWKRFKMKDVCKKISVGIATSTTKYFVDKGIPLLRNQNIKEGYIETDDLLHISEEFAKMNQSKKLQEGDIVCMRTGYPGQSAVVPAKMNGWQTFTTLIVRPNYEILNSFFLSIFLNSFGRKQIISFQAGVAQQNLNVGWLSNMLILIPSLPEQQKIVSILSNVDSLIQNQQEYKSKLTALKKGLMQKLLTGQIRVRV